MPFRAIFNLQSASAQIALDRARHPQEFASHPPVEGIGRKIAPGIGGARQACR